jgi:hypothetical protein
MDLAIALGQGAGLAVACGLLAGLPLAVAALAALLLGFDDIGEPGAARLLDDGLVVAILCVFGAVDAIGELRLPERAQLAMRAVAGALVFELVAHDELSWVGLVLGFVIAGLAATVGVRLLTASARAGSVGSATVLAVAAAVIAAVVSIIPFAGYVVLAAGAFLVVRNRQQADEKYRGLRILR